MVRKREIYILQEGTRKTGRKVSITMAELNELRFLVASAAVGGIIGRGGANIGQIRNESSAELSVSGTAGSERVLTVKGNKISVCSAVALLADKINELATPDNVDPAKCVMTLLVPNSQCGPLIGKEGKQIKELRESANATIVIPLEHAGSSTERAVKICGSSSAISKAVAHMMKIFTEFPARPNNIKFCPGMSEQAAGCRSLLSLNGVSRYTEVKMKVPASETGLLIGKKGRHINAIRQQSNAQVSIEESERANQFLCVVSGSPEAVSTAVFLINSRLNGGKEGSRRGSKGKKGDE